MLCLSLAVYIVCSKQGTCSWCITKMEGARKHFLNFVGLTLVIFLAILERLLYEILSVLFNPVTDSCICYLLGKY